MSDVETFVQEGVWGAVRAINATLRLWEQDTKLHFEEEPA